MWWVYILRCADGTFYTGIATDIGRRVAEHNRSPKSAKYTRARRPVSLIYKSSHPTRSEALIEEARIKKLSRKQKEMMVI